MKTGFVNGRAAQVFAECCRSTSMEDIKAAPDKTPEERMSEAREAVKAMNAEAVDSRMAEVRAAVKEALYGENQ